MAFSIEKKLHRQLVEYAHQKIDTTCLKEFPPFLLLGNRYGPFVPGHSYKLDMAIAQILLENGIIKIQENEDFSHKTLQKINYQESNRRDLGKIEDLAYIRAKNQMDLLSRLQNAQKIPRQSFTAFYSELQDLIRVRLAKISRLTLQAQDQQGKNILTGEEAILYAEISQKIKEWRNFLAQLG